MKRCSYLIKNDFISAVIDMRPYNINRSHPNATTVLNALKQDDADEALRLIDLMNEIREVEKEISNITNDSGFEIRGNRVFFNDKEAHGALINQILETKKAGDDITGLVNFFINLKQNPSYRAVNELWDWMDACGITSITPDGYFLAYKKIRGNWTDIHSGKFDNSIGSICEVNRNEVDENAERTCSFGLHFCSYSYLSHFGSCSDNKVVILKINPADVVAIPVDYGNAKGRCCKYEVVDEVKDWKNNHILTTPTNDSYYEEEFEEDYNEPEEYDDDELENWNITDDEESTYLTFNNDSKKLELLQSVDALSVNDRILSFGNIHTSFELTLKDYVNIYNEVYNKKLVKFTDRPYAKKYIVNLLKVDNAESKQLFNKLVKKYEEKSLG